MKVPEKERGAALLAVLLLVAVMGAISASALGKLRLSTALAVNNAAAGQARAFALGIESLIALTVDDLTARSRERTTLAGDWNGAVRRYPLPGGGFAQARVRDGGNCFNINSVGQGNEIAGLVVRPVGVAQFVGLMRLIEIPEGQAMRIASAAADWVDSDGDPLREGAEDGAYSAGATPYRTANTLFAEVSELRAVAGMTPEIYERVRPWLCALPVTDLSPVNVNTLSPDQAPLLAMLDPARVPLDSARRLLAERPAAGWDGLTDFWDMPAVREVMMLVPVEVQLQPQIRTDWFALDMMVELQGAELIETALVDARTAPAQIAVRRWGEED